MKKKRVKRKRKFYSYEKKSLVIGFGILLIFSLLVGFADFNKGVEVTGQATGDIFNIGGDYNIFGGSEPAAGAKPSPSTGIFSTRTNLIIAKYILFFILSMVFYWIVSGIVKKNEKGAWFGKLLFALAVAYLSIAFIALDEIYSLMTVYSALGATITVVIPFILCVVLSVRLVAEGIMTTSKRLIEWGLWGVYLLFLIYYLFATIIRPANIQANVFMNFIIGIIALSAFLIFVFNDRFVKFLRNVRRKVKDANTRAKLDEAKRIAAETQHKEEMHKITTDLKKQQALNKRLGKEIQDFYRYS